MIIKTKTILKKGWFVDSQGFEPQMTEPKSVVLPLHHESLFVLVVQIYSFFLYIQELFEFFFKFTVEFIHGKHADRLQ